MSENGEDESFVILSSSQIIPSLTSIAAEQSTSINETIVKCTPAKEGLDDLAANIRLQFPNLSSSSSIKEEMIKLESILEEYMELKDALQKSNVEMREHFTALKKWQDEVRTQKEIHAKQFNEFQETVAKLRNENLELQKGFFFMKWTCVMSFNFSELEHKTGHEKEENREMTKMLSDKTAQIQNMAVQIGKLEQQHMDSSEYIRQLKCENEEEKESNKLKIEHEYVPLLEHRRIVSDLEEKLSETAANNLKFDEMEEKYSKEVKKLKDYIVKTESENEELKESNKLKIEREYIPVLEHRRIVRDVEEKLSETVAKNLDEVEEKYSKEVKKLKDYIVKTESENEELKESNKLKIEREYVPILEHRRIVSDLEEKLSETAANNLKFDEMILAYSKEIKKLKDHIVKNESEYEEESEINKLKMEHEYVPILEHRRIVRDVEEKLSETVAKNLESDEMIQEYSKEVKKLKDYIVKNESEYEEEKESNKLKIEREYIPILEHRRIVRDVEEKLLETVAKNLAEMEEKYSKEVKKLKDYIVKNESEYEEEKESNKLIIEREYIPILEHRRIVRDVEEKLSETVAKNLESDEMMQKYSEEVKELKDHIDYLLLD